jgi:hypothetical protein
MLATMVLVTEGEVIATLRHRWAVAGVHTPFMH